MTDQLTYHRVGVIGQITLNQPKRRNAISKAMWHNLGETVHQAINDQAVKLIVITGNGDHFAAGADITEFEAVYKTKEDARAYTRTMLDSLKILEKSTKLTVAKIRGACVGGGCSIALACDIRYADSTAKFGITPGKLGLVYSIDDTRRLIRTVGRANAVKMLSTGRIIDVADAESIKLADKVINPDGLDHLISDLATELNNISPWSIKATKEMIALLDDGADDSNSYAAELMDDAFTGPDFKEGYEAFLAKRKPEFPSQ